MATATDSLTTAPEVLQRDPRWEDEKARLWAMTPSERVHAMRAGELALRLCLHWVSRCPDECPVLDGEWEFIAIHTPEAADPDRHAVQRERVVDSLLRRPDVDELRANAP
jgi:hypothetical protein